MTKTKTLFELEPSSCTIVDDCNCEKGNIEKNLSNDPGMQHWGHVFIEFYRDAKINTTKPIWNARIDNMGG